MKRPTINKLTAITSFIFLITSNILGQNIEIGDSANEIKSLIEFSVNEHDKADSYGNTLKSYWTWNVEYENDQITDVIQCYNNQYLIGLGTITFFCKHYIMQNGLLAYTLTEFENLSTEKLNEYFEDSYGEYKSGELFFSKDYMHYSKVCVSDSGNASVEWRKTDLNELPSNIKTDIENKLKELQGEDHKIKEGEMQEEKVIKSKTYDLEINDSVNYYLFIYDLRRSLIEELKSGSLIPDWGQVKNEKNKYITFKNSYSALYKLVDYSKEIADNGDMLMTGNHEIGSENNYILISGDDNTCELLKASPLLPTINYQGYNVLTDASVRDINVSYVKGMTKVRIDNGDVTYKKYPPPTEVRDSVSQKLKTITNGLYWVKYQSGNVMGKSFTITEKEKENTLTGKILRVTVVILLLSIYVIIDNS